MNKISKIFISENASLYNAILQLNKTGTRCLFEAARKTAMSFKFTSNENAPNPQIGFVSVNFKLGQ